jgi:antirestriction protein ArdC
MKTSDVCEQITNSIIAELENGVLPWTKPWLGKSGLSVPRRHNGARYKGINVLILWSKAKACGYESPFWMTYKQATSYGANVRKGEKATQIVYTNLVKKTEQDANGQDVEHKFSFLKTYNVFNVEQIDGLPEKFALPKVTIISEVTKNWTAYNNCFAWFEAIPASVKHGGNKAYYSTKNDCVHLPERDSFVTEQKYLSTRGHETIHWTGHESRLNRNFNQDRWGSEAYAMEELVAELGAAFLMAEVGLIPEIREDHAPYISHWLTVMKRDSRAIMSAASKASQALDYLVTFNEDEEDSDEDVMEREVEMA